MGDASLSPLSSLDLGPFVRRPMSSNPGFLFLLFKSIFSENFLLYLYRAFNHQTADQWNLLNLLLKLLYQNSNFALTLGYLNSL